MDASRPYPAGTEWRFRSQRSSFTRTTELSLRWELNGDPISDDYYQSETSADELWRIWVRWLNRKDGWSKRLGPPWLHIYWSIRGRGTFETAPFQYCEFPISKDFLSFYTWPEHAHTEEDLNWSRLPVANKLWREKSADKGGFIQEVSGWKPSAYQSHVNLRTLAETGGLYFEPYRYNDADQLWSVDGT